MEYLLRVQKAIALTENVTTDSHDYAEGWIEAKEDLKYGISLGSDYAVMQQIKYWTDPVFGESCADNLEDEGDKGYSDRMQEIHKLIEGRAN